LTLSSRPSWAGLHDAGRVSASPMTSHAAGGNRGRPTRCEIGRQIRGDPPSIARRRPRAPQRRPTALPCRRDCPVLGRHKRNGTPLRCCRLGGAAGRPERWASLTLSFRRGAPPHRCRHHAALKAYLSRSRPPHTQVDSAPSPVDPIIKIRVPSLHHTAQCHPGCLPRAPSVVPRTSVAGKTTSAHGQIIPSWSITAVEGREPSRPGAGQ
jgi:hypothetical protein